MNAVLKPRLRLIDGEFVAVAPERETAIQAARRRYGRPFAHERGSSHRHESGPTFWTAERIAQLAAENDARRRSR